MCVLSSVNIFIMDNVLLLVGVTLFMLWITAWLYNFSTRGVCVSRARMDGKTVIISGSDSGIGKATAFDLARRGARVIMACINLQQAYNVRDSIIRETRNPEVEVKFVDLSSLKSVRKFAEDVVRTESRLDVLIHNAGVLIPPKPRTEDGLDMVLATNHFGPFLLSNLLIEPLKKSGQGRIIVVSSRSHRVPEAVVDPEDPSPEWKHKLHPYYMSKFACILCAKEMARRLQGTGVTVNSLHPGLVCSNIAVQWLPECLYPIIAFILPFVKTPEQGAQTSIFLAVSEDVEGVSGKYFSNCKERPAAKKTDDLELAQRYWDVCEKVVGLQLKSSKLHIY